MSSNGGPIDPEEKVRVPRNPMDYLNLNSSPTKRQQVTTREDSDDEEEGDETPGRLSADEANARPLPSAPPAPVGVLVPAPAVVNPPGGPLVVHNRISNWSKCRLVVAFMWIFLFLVIAVGLTALIYWEVSLRDNYYTDLNARYDSIDHDFVDRPDFHTVVTNQIDAYNRHVLHDVKKIKRRVCENNNDIEERKDIVEEANAIADDEAKELACKVEEKRDIAIAMNNFIHESSMEIKNRVVKNPFRRMTGLGKNVDYVLQQSITVWEGKRDVDRRMAKAELDAQYEKRTIIDTLADITERIVKVLIKTGVVKPRKTRTDSSFFV